MKIERMTLDSNTCLFQIKSTTHMNYKNKNLFFIKEGINFNKYRFGKVLSR